MCEVLASKDDSRSKTLKIQHVTKKSGIVKQPKLNILLKNTRLNEKNDTRQRGTSQAKVMLIPNWFVLLMVDA